MPIYKDLPYIGPPNHYGNSYSEKDGITVHCTANDASAKNEAGWATRRPESVSSHYYVDGIEIVQSLNTDLRAWHAGSSWPNTYCISYEFTGFNSWSRAKWLDRIDWDAAAKQIARDCTKWKIPARWVTVPQLRSGTHGFNTHNECRLAFGGTSHTDPGPNFPKDHLLNRVKHFLSGGDMALTDADVEKLIHAPVITLNKGEATESKRSMGWFFQHIETEQDATHRYLAALETRLQTHHDEVRELVEKGLSGELAAEEVVRLLGEKLSSV